MIDGTEASLMLNRFASGASISDIAALHMCARIKVEAVIRGAFAETLQLLALAQSQRAQPDPDVLAALNSEIKLVTEH